MSEINRKLGFDGWLALAFVAAAIAAFAFTYTYPAAAALWPRWVIGAFGVLSALVPASKLLTGEDV